MWGLCWICIGRPSFFEDNCLLKHETWREIIHFFGMRWENKLCDTGEVICSSCKILAEPSNKLRLRILLNFWIFSSLNLTILQLKYKKLWIRLFSRSQNFSVMKDSFDSLKLVECGIVRQFNKESHEFDFLMETFLIYLPLQVLLVMFWIFVLNFQLRHNCSRLLLKQDVLNFLLILIYKTSSVDAIAISELWNYFSLTHTDWLTHCQWQG